MITRLNSTGVNQMTYAQLIKKASRASVLCKRVEEQASTYRREREQSLSEALPYVRSVADATRIFQLSDDKGTQTFAWKKAVILLGSSAKDFGDLISIIKCNFYPSQKEADVANDLSSKREMILSGLTMEQWYELLMESPKYSDLSRKAEKGMAEVLAGIQDIELVYHWSNIMTSWHTERKHGELLSWRYECERALKRLAPVEPQDAKKNASTE